MFRVLLPVDEDVDRSIDAAKTIVSLPNAAESVTVTLLNVTKKIDVTGGEGGHVDSGEWYDEEELPESVRKTRDYLEGEGLAVEVRRDHADPAEAILETATELGVDRIVMSGRKRTPVGKVLFGSVTQSVLLGADVPVTVAFR